MSTTASVVAAQRLSQPSKLNRNAFLMELDPHYCDVIIARWEKLTGEKAVKIDEFKKQVE